MFTHCIFPIMMLLYAKHAIWTLFRASLLQWLKRRRAHLLRAQQGIPVSEYGVLVDMIQVPDWAFEAVGQEMRGMGQEAAYQPGLYLTAAQVLLKPIVSQLVVEPPASLEEYTSIPSIKEVDDLLVVCVSQMAVTAGNGLIWKPLNHEEDLSLPNLCQRIMKQQLGEKSWISCTKAPHKVLGWLYMDLNSNQFERLLKEICADEDGDLLIESAVKNIPKVFVVSTLVSAVPAQPFIFRNYQYPAGTPEIPFAISEGSRSTGRGNANDSPQVGYKCNAFIGSSKHHVWQAIRASSAAPYYLLDFSHDVYRWQDGAIVANNPTIFSIHGAQLLWPDTKIDCFVSIGCGSVPIKDCRSGRVDGVIWILGKC